MYLITEFDVAVAKNIWFLMGRFYQCFNEYHLQSFLRFYLLSLVLTPYGVLGWHNLSTALTRNFSKIYKLISFRCSCTTVVYKYKILTFEKLLCRLHRHSCRRFMHTFNYVRYLFVGSDITDIEAASINSMLCRVGLEPEPIFKTKVVMPHLTAKSQFVVNF